MKKTTNTTQTTEKNTTNTLNINKLTIQELRNFLDYAYNSLSSKKETKDSKRKMAIDLLTNLKKKKVILKKSEYTDTAKIILKEFPELNKFFGKEETKEDKKEVKKEDNKKEETKKEDTKKEEVKKEVKKKEVKAEEKEEVKKEVVKTNKEDERAFPSGIKLERKTFRKVDSITFEEVKKRVDEGKDIIVAYYWSKNDLEVFGYCNAEYIKKPTQFRYNLDLVKVVYTTSNLIYAISLQTDAVYMLTVEDFNRHENGYLYSCGVEFEIYSSK